MEGCCVSRTAERCVTMQALRAITCNALRHSSHLASSAAFARVPKPIVQSPTFSSPCSSLLDSRSSLILGKGLVQLRAQEWSRCLSTRRGPIFRVSATADVRETREAPSPEELEREERRPLPRSLPPRPLKDVWVRPGVTPPPEALDFEEPPRKSFARPPRNFRENEGYGRQKERKEKNSRSFSRSDDSWFDGPPAEGDKRAAESDKPAKSVVKKKVAVWLGYVGTDYKGSMMQRGQPGPTVEGVLEEAIFKAGGMKESNYGDFKKIGWNRSSRTDKGVHALASVVSFKMEVPAEVFAHDPDGLSLADRINAHLPPIIRVYGVQPVTKSFNAYHNCRARTYEYVLPAPLIGISDDMDDVAAQEALDQLQAILTKYEGRQPFHNFTVRRLYRPGKKGSKRKVTRLTQESETLVDLEGAEDDSLPIPPRQVTVTEASASDTTTESDVGSSGFDEGVSKSDAGSSGLVDLEAHLDSDELYAEQSEDPWDATRGHSDAAGSYSDAEGDYSDALGDDSDSFARDSDAFDGGPDGFERGDDDSEFYRPSAADHFFADRRESEELELEYDEEEEDDEGSWVERRGPTAQWLLETPPEDRIGPSHYRRILSATCTDLEPLGRSRVVRIHFEGESFMLHQIRKMVGAAVAIMRGDFPLELLDAALACHSRIILPMAPAEGLFLSRTRFFPFRTSFNRDFTSDGPALEMTPPMEMAREEFRKTQLLPAMAPLLDAERDPWTSWVAWLEKMGPVPQEEVTEVLSCFEEWRSHQPERGSETRERPPWFQNAQRARPNGPRPWASRGGTQSGGMGGRWGRS